MRHAQLIAFSLAIALFSLAAVPAPATDAAVVNIVEPPLQPVKSWHFDPATLTVKVGTTVTWINTGAVVHTVTTDDGKTFDSGNLKKNATFSFKADVPGTFTYFCKFHRWMKATIVVQP
jgi:plastocyanin